ncbi:hypothetical protein CY34DRAFT_784253 [Suillus luteus UH-Slu-Lm8-n1]|uniref:HAT C-terminal dimerisation domain-containing protein n=1 Tax=Suillus luteus UH-Slu-Lm8-n1 TaxID=930992 RepID=A0A0D0A3P5_9AGAM|nr:hypothetical protein CY34DRAFT_784253 [Suillus luteus UH-Slu-Lm8-n1]
MDTESVHVQQEEIDRLKARNQHTLLLDGWEDLLKRSLYGSVAVEVKQLPVVLALEDMTGSRAVTTDNPTIMQSFCRKFQESYFWVLTFPCFLHSLNTLIGEICSFPLMKQTVLKSTCIVNFFNSSHYWGGQLNGEAKKQGINRKMKQNCESRFYALILQSMSVLAYWSPLSHTCLCPDAQKRTNNQTPVAPAVIATLVKTVKFLIDAIGNLESREATLADCMLELIRCARQMSQLELDADDDDTGFWMHAKSVFNRRFHAINTELHSLALFLHPMCQKLAVMDASKGRPFEFMVKTALAVAKQWRWGEQKAKLLVNDLKAYNLCRAPFSGGQVDGLAWWESLAVSAEGHPLKALAITLLSIVPHAADVERLFSDMGSTQSPKRCNLSKAVVNGKPIRHRHAHMHTNAQPGINSEVAADLKVNFAWAPPLAAQTQNIDDNLAGPESISLDEIDTAFAQLECKKDVIEREPVDGNEVLEGQVYDFVALEHVDHGIEHTSRNDGQWDVDVLMSSNGVS